MGLKYFKNRHSCYKLTYHLVVVTKYRNKVINKEVGERLESIVNFILKENWKCDLIQFNYEDDHMHILFGAPPQVQLSKLINNLKTVTSRRLRKEFEEHISKYYWKPYFWSNSYLILSTGGAPIEVIKKYIENQDKPK